ncbi:hypothetical protein FPZ24_12755 [Sphingomonas panacisoli]|uniref:17 kDa surface antigen n=1 Tax=Sphingomonas panacisoli TaxID=1813879 RepID=A0A5B8LMG2_9SPHN|nr:hypothetical protein [Sphingomonas panacisoli]QDZ08240.1 hypothetical protein FPZ24_12755 [Sphingomonas panacisoli]
MNKFLTKSVLGATLAATALTVAAPADAQRYRRYHDRGDATGAAILGGVAGLAIGAAIASNNNRDRYYRNDYYYNDNYRYNDYPRYNDYYYRERYVQRCRMERRYDPYYGGTYRVRVCY